VDGPLYVFERGKKAVMDIRQMKDSKAVMRRVKPVKPDLGLGDLRVRRERRRDIRLTAAD
jgi:hypothetical protein